MSNFYFFYPARFFYLFIVFLFFRNEIYVFILVVEFCVDFAIFFQKKSKLVVRKSIVREMPPRKKKNLLFLEQTKMRIKCSLKKKNNKDKIQN